MNSDGLPVTKRMLNKVCVCFSKQQLLIRLRTLHLYQIVAYHRWCIIFHPSEVNNCANSPVLIKYIVQDPRVPRPYYFLMDKICTIE